MYRAGLESMLGLRRRGATFAIDPCIPSSWTRYDISWRYGAARYDIAVFNPHSRCEGVVSAELDGRSVDPRAIPLTDDGELHHVRVLLGPRGDSRERRA